MNYPYCRTHKRWFGCPACVIAEVRRDEQEFQRQLQYDIARGYVGTAKGGLAATERIAKLATGGFPGVHKSVHVGERPGGPCPGFSRAMSMMGFSPRWETKYWGRTRCVAKGPAFEVHELEIKMGGFSSKHEHRKWNQFTVMSGTLRVELFAKTNPTGPATGEVELQGGTQFESLEVPTGFVHRFVALTDCHVLEVYWTDQIDPGDIVRYDEGGLNP